MIGPLLEGRSDTTTIKGKATKSALSWLELGGRQVCLCFSTNYSINGGPFSNVFFSPTYQQGSQFILVYLDDGVLPSTTQQLELLTNGK